MRRMLAGIGLAALALPFTMGTSALASGCTYTTTEAGPTTVFTDSDFPAGDPFGVWVYVDFDGDGVTRDDSGCDVGEDGKYSTDWVF